MSTSPPRPEVVSAVAALRDVLGAARQEGKKIGLVPTMGALHQGHLSLVRASSDECDYTVVSIYVNPSQFGAGEDFDQYPRTLETDLDALAEHGVPLVFAPRNEEVYPTGYATWVEVGAVAEPWEGACRPGHFRGVATIVLKLFNMVQPDVAYFGQKDYQQALVIRRMVEDLNLPIAIRVCPTVREPDGLAMSSRNAYLDPAERQRALVLWKSLCLAGDLVDQGERSAPAIAERMRQLILSAGDAKIDYVALADPETLEPVDQIRGPTVAALAVRIGPTRLIDNRLIEPPKS
jgi:pantoate--beta-alanine ligase